MSFDKIFDLTAGVYFNFHNNTRYKILQLAVIMAHLHGAHALPITPMCTYKKYVVFHLKPEEMKKAKYFQVPGMAGRERTHSSRRGLSSYTTNVQKM